MDDKRAEAERCHRHKNRIDGAGLVIFAVVYLIALLVKGLFSKNKFVKVVSAAGLVALAIGTVVAVRMAMNLASKVRGAGQDGICEQREASSAMSAEIAPDSPGDPAGGEKPQTSGAGARTRPVAAKTHDWQALCRREWRKTFPCIQGTFARFGGFRLAQAPVDGIAMDGDRQMDVPLRSRYRYFQKADLEFSHGALVGFKLKAHFDKKYSMASVVNEGNATKRCFSCFEWLAPSRNWCESGFPSRIPLCKLEDKNQSRGK